MTDRPPMAPPCPMTVIGGFLGAGKTTLVNRLLSSARGRYAVLVNDFGAVNVDARLILSHDGETLRLTNGCVCCSMSDDFVTTLIRVLDAREPFDHIVIEASGVGDPWAIAEIALVEPQVSLHAVLVLADAERIGALIDDQRLGGTVRRQIEAADIVLLNKIDLIDSAMRARVTKRLTALKPGLRIVPTVAADVPDDLLSAAIPDRAATSAGRRTSFRAEAVHHESQFHRIIYRRQGAFDRERLDKALHGLPPSLLRLKGTCALDDKGALLLQLVARRWSLTPPVGESPADSAWAIELVGIATDSFASRHVFDELDLALVRDSQGPDTASTPTSQPQDPLLSDAEG